MEDLDLRYFNPLSLAYLGDAIWEVEIRKYYFKENLKVADLNIKVKKCVNAKFQSRIYVNLLESLNEEEINISKKAKNGKIKSYPKSCKPNEYRNSTAFEALIAYYYYENKLDKIDKIIKKYVVEGDE